MTSKLVFLSKEEIERILIRNLSYNGKDKKLWIDRLKITELLRDCDINHTKRKFSQILSTMIIPKNMLINDFTESEHRESEDDFEESKQDITFKSLALS